MTHSPIDTPIQRLSFRRDAGAGARARLGLLTSYAPEVTQAMQDSFCASGIEIATVGSFYEDDDTVVGRIDQSSLFDAICTLGAGPCGGVFVACTACAPPPCSKRPKTLWASLSRPAILHWPGTFCALPGFLTYQQNLAVFSPCRSDNQP